MKKVLFFIIITCWFAGAAMAQKAEKVLDDIQEQYEKQDNMCAEYTQTFIWKLAGETQTVEGKICIKNQNKFRIESPTQTIIMDGQTVWTINKVNKQIIIDRASEQSNDHPFLKNFIDSFNKDYHVALNEKGGRDHFGLTLTAKTEDQFIREIELLADKKTKFLTGIERTDVNGNTTIYTVKNIDTGVRLDAAQFKLGVQEGYEIVDMR